MIKRSAGWKAGLGLALMLGALWGGTVTGATRHRVQCDFDGDRVSDFAVVRNTGGGPTGTITWFMLRSDELGAARPLFRSVTPTGGNLRLVFTTEPGTNYVLQSLTVLTQATWNTIGGITGTGQAMTNFVPLTTNRVINFRLRPT